MLNMPDINDIRNLAREGYKISEIARMTNRDRKTIRKYLEIDDFSEKPPITQTQESILDPFKETIREWIQQDRQTWEKQRHTAKRIYDRLVEEKGYTGSYDTVRKYVKPLRIRANDQGTQDLIWEPGCAQVDFGEADFQEDTQIVRRKYLVVSFPYSNDGYVQVFGGENAECVCQGLKDIFEYIGGVPPILIFDNATGVGKRICDTVHETKMFQRFRAHYGFRVRFCNPYAGYEKGNVEAKVGYERRNLFVPIPRYHDMIEYNKTLLPLHELKAGEKHYKKGIRIRDLFEDDRKAFFALPPKAFEVITYDWFKADGYGEVCIDRCHHYSTRPEYHNQKVLIGKRAHYIDVLDENGILVVRHRRMYGKERTDSCDYSTTLEVLSRNAGAWENSGLRRELPDPLRGYLDGLEKKERKRQLRLMSELNQDFGYDAAIDAMVRALDNNGQIRRTDAMILAQRITGYGINTPPDPGPSLEAYDRMFLPDGERSGQAC